MHPLAKLLGQCRFNFLIFQAVQEELSYERYLLELAQRECEVRRYNKIARIVKASKLPLEKTLENFNLKRLPLRIRHQARALIEGSFVDRCENVPAFGKTGSGKTHLLCAVCHELARQGRRVYFATCDLMVQELLRAKQQLVLDKLLRKLSKFDVLMIDDFGYVKQNREEMGVLFTLLAHRYERGSLLITSNLPFSQWETIFKLNASLGRILARRLTLYRFAVSFCSVRTAQYGYLSSRSGNSVTRRLVQP